MLLAYCCLPYSAATPEGIEANKDAARALARRINSIPGWRAVCPHLISGGIESSLPEDAWVDLDVELLNRACDVLVYDRDRSTSKGCMRERLAFGGPQIDQQYLEDFAAHLAAQLVGRAVRRGRC